MAYIENPCPATSLQLQSKVFLLKLSQEQREAEMEKRITDKVLSALSVRLDAGGAIKEVDSLNRAIERLGQ